MPRTRIGARFTTAKVPAGAATATLPPDLLARAGDRVRIAALAFGGVWLIALILMNPLARLLQGHRIETGAWPMPGNAIAASGLALSLAFAFLARRLQDRPVLVLNLGLGYEVVTAALFALIGNWVFNPRPGLTWAAVVVLLYPAIAPAGIRKTTAASFIAVSMGPLFYLVSHLRGTAPALPAIDLIWRFIGDYVAAGLALVPATVIHRLGKEVRDARDLGSYRLGELLGKGGMGEVYRATHRFLARPAAVKLITPREAGEGAQSQTDVAVERFKREASAAAALSSPHTIELYDFGVSEDGTFFYVMEMLNGIDFQVLVEKHGPQPPARVIHLLRQACDSLAEAHQLGMVHRDIKPSNIFTCRLGLDVDFVKLLDFGIVKVSEPEAPGTPQLTTPELTVGTPAFISPEAAGGSEVDARSDLYALGCVGFWLLTGELVFKGANVMQILVKHIQEAPRRPGEVLGRPLPADLEAVILTCLAKAPGERYPDAIALRKALDQCADARTWTDEMAHAWWTAHLPA
jgi:serine/threonine-protein kinase